MNQFIKNILSSDYCYEKIYEFFLHPLEQKLNAKPIIKENDLKNSEPIIQTNDSIISFLQKVNYTEFGSIVHFDIYDITLKNTADIQKNRQILHTILQQKSFTSHAAFFLIHYENTIGKTWQFSLITKDETSSRRYTYVLGKEHSIRTAVAQLTKFLETTNHACSIKELTEAFAIEPVTEEFYKGRGTGLPAGNKDEPQKSFKEWKKLYENRYLDFGYYQWYQLFQSYAAEHKNNPNTFGQFFKDCDDVIIRHYVKKLFGRIVFLFFLQKKGWMGCQSLPGSNATDWTSGNRNFMQHLIDTYYRNPTKYNYTTESKEHSGFLDAVLEPLFEECFCKNRKDDFFTPQDNIIFNTDFKGLRFPYLNEDLFQSDDINPPISRFPNEYFKRLFDFFNGYHFTLDENTSDDIEIGIDPEMLGKIFEELLEDNKDKGTFYTPKEIVDEMCRDSLLAYLSTDDTTHEQELQNFIQNHTLPPNFTFQQRHKLLKKLEDVKICDPAMGSGAFPMGLLQELVQCRRAFRDDSSDYELKKYIILNNIYGVDIDPGAVDIARLRLWLSLIVDADTPQPLPNLDYKVMQGNALLEWYQDHDLSRISDDTNHNAPKTKKKHRQLVGDETVLDNKMEPIQKNTSMLNWPENLYATKLQAAVTQFNVSTNTKVQDHLIKTILENAIYLYEYATDTRTTEQIMAFLKELIKAINLNAAIKLYENVTEHQLRQLFKDRINTQIQDLLKTKANLKLKGVHPSANAHFFLWHTWFKDVFDKGGFDIVIGNPPFIDSEKMSATDPTTRSICTKIYEAAKGNWDIYIAFFNLGYHLLNNKSILSFITPNKWLSIPYGQSLRNLCGKDIFKITDYSEVKVFDAGVNSIVTYIQKGLNTDTINCKKYNEDYTLAFNLCNLNKSIAIHADNYSLLFSKHIEILNILTNNKTLKDYYTVVSAGATNDAYKLARITYDSESPQDNAFKIITTGAIRKCRTLWGIKRQRIDNAYYFHPYVSRDNLMNMHQTRFTLAKTPKILVSGRRYLDAFADFKGEYAPYQSVPLIIQKDLSLKALLPIINSSLAFFFMYESFSGLALDGGITFTWENLSYIPFPELSNSDINQLELYANELIQLGDHFNKDDLKKLDLFVCSLYFRNISKNAEQYTKTIVSFGQEKMRKRG